MIYENLTFNKNSIRKIEPSFNINFIDGAYIEVKNSQPNKEYKIQMVYDNHIHYEAKLKKGMWARSGIKYLKNWIIKIFSDDELITQHTFNLEDKRVYIAFDSKSIGDTLAWIPYVEEFRKFHNCNVIVSTFHNDLFREQYPKVQFVSPGEVVNNLYAMYKIGWYYEGDSVKISQNPRDFKLLPLQQTITDILGLDFKEVLPKLNLPKVEKQKKVGIAIHSTAQSKYWNNSTGWQEVVDYLISIGYEVVLYSRENDGYMGNFHPKGISKFRGGSLQEVIADLSSCEFFIGLGSGLTWLAWACNLPVVLISGFSKPYSEMTINTYRVFNESVCNGCFNTHRLNAGDWNWCPVHKGSERQFECTKQISGNMVIKKIEEVLKITSI